MFRSVNRSVVTMLVMNVGKVRMAVANRFVVMLMGVRLDSVPLVAVCVLMMRIVHVCVSVRHRVMDVLVLVVLGDMQPDAKSH